jgi:hypothetical protein
VGTLAGPSTGFDEYPPGIPIILLQSAAFLPRRAGRVQGRESVGSWFSRIKSVPDNFSVPVVTEPAAQRGHHNAPFEIIILRERGLTMATATDGLRTALHTTARVQSGNKIEITAPQLTEGQDVDVFLIPRPSEPHPGRSVLEFLDSLPPGPRSASSWNELERQFQEERNAWDR